MNDIVWQPSEKQIKESNMYRFMQAVNQEYGCYFEAYAQLHRWSVENLTEFWRFYSEYSGIKFRERAHEVLVSREMPGARWFPSAKLNYTENLLVGPPEKTAIVSKAEGKPLVHLTYAQLSRQVADFALALNKRGIHAGDRVAGYLPNIPETVVAHLGAAAIGAVWSSCSPDFGRQGVLDRFKQIEPSVLICVDGYSYNGRHFSTIETINTLVREIPSLKHVIVIPFYDPDFKISTIEFDSAFIWSEFAEGVGGQSFNFPSFPFNHPLSILYSSGTTGLPKCIVHGAGGTLLQHHKEHALHTNIGPDDVVFYYTSTGWMMWNWLVSALAQQATIVLYDGSPAYPSLATLWQLVEETGITVFGTSPKFIAMNRNDRQTADLHTVRAILSTGSPLDQESFYWVYENIKKDVMLSSISGGSDIISCFMLGNPMLPVRAGEIQCVGLGMDVVAVNSADQPVLDQKGELVCRSPSPSMPLYFWNDEGYRKYRQAYFHRVPGLWFHGDYIEIKAHGGVVVYGRSDATLKPGGVRIGTAEIYRVVETMDNVLDSLVIGVEECHDVTVILFVVLASGTELDGALMDKIKLNIRKETSPRHVPREIYRVSDVPRTLNGKKVELMIRDIFMGHPVLNQHVLANPECLGEYEGVKSRRLACKAER